MCSEHTQAFHLFLGILPTAPRNNLAAPENAHMSSSSSKHRLQQLPTLCNGFGTFSGLVYHGVILEIAGEGNWVPEVFQAGIVRLHWAGHVKTPT